MNVYLVDIKNEYTNHLIKMLVPLIYEGIQSIYDKAKDCIEDQSLKLFQEYLRTIPEWNNNILNNEVSRIKAGSKSYLENLVKATLKANIMLLSFNPFNQSKQSIEKQSIEKQSIDKSIIENINLTNFIHQVYIECARDFWNNPYLFYHNYSPIDTKRNQRDAIMVIKDCIREAIRRVLPIEDVMKLYLADDISPEKEEKIKNNLKEFTEDEVKSEIPNTTGFTEVKGDNKENFNNTPIDNNTANTDNNTANTADNNTADNNTADNNTVDNNTANTDREKSYETPANQSTVEETKKMTGGNYSVTSANLLDKIEMKLNSNQSNTEVVKKEHFDTKIEDMLGDTDIDTSLNYSIENNLNNYQEIYGNN